MVLVSLFSGHRRQAENRGGSLIKRWQTPIGVDDSRISELGDGRYDEIALYNLMPVSTALWT